VHGEAGRVQVGVAALCRVHTTTIVTSAWKRQDTTS
jgi:hypothetical protein